MVKRTIIAFAMFYSFASAQDLKLDRLKNAEIEIAKIRSEINELGKHPWAGEYASSGGTDTGVVLFIAPKSGIAYQEYDNAGVSDTNYGVFPMDGATIRIKWSCDPASTMSALFPCVEKDLVIVSWDEEVFLVSRSLVHRFCMIARENQRFFHSIAIARSPNKRKTLAGKPILPEELKVFLDLPELSANITDVEKPVTFIADKNLRIIRQIVTMDIGAKDYVYLGMKLEGEKQGKQHARMMRITEIDDNSSKAEALDFDFKKVAAPISPIIKAGTKVKTAKW